MDVQPLLDGNARSGEWIALRVHLENPGPAVRGELRVTTSDRTTSSYGTEVELPTGARQDHVIHTRSGPFGSRMTISLVSDGATVVSARASTRNVPEGTSGVYVVAEHPERLMGDIRASRDTRQGATDVVDIGALDLPPRVEAWSAVDRLVWQDVSFGSLDAARLDALVTWVALGGDLTIVGGSTGTAALEALPEELLPFVPDRMIDVPARDLVGVLGRVPVGARLAARNGRRAVTRIGAGPEWRSDRGRHCGARARDRDPCRVRSVRVVADRDIGGFRALVAHRAAD
jgi:hypothetical protein